MSISEMLLPEFDQEMSSTRKLLERVPEDHWAWKPHEKSMSLGRLAGHVAEIPSWAVNTIRMDSLDLSSRAADYKPMVATSRKELVETFDKNVAEARDAIRGASDEHLAKVWTLYWGGKTVVAMPRAAVVRAFMMNHLIHHRAQLGVYLRLKNVAIPGMYGPSADEGQMFTTQSA